MGEAEVEVVNVEEVREGGTEKQSLPLQVVQRPIA